MFRSLVIISLFFTLAIQGRLVAGQEKNSAEISLYMESLVESLNATTSGRTVVVKKIANELKEANRNILYNMLLEYLDNSSLLIQIGIVESLARSGKIEALPVLCRHLRLVPHTEVRLSILRLLPAFLFFDDERTRLNYINQIETQHEELTGDLIILLRQPPVSRRGRFSPQLDQIRLQIITAAGSQLDPVSALLAEMKINDSRYLARKSLLWYLGDMLGKDDSLWLDNWLNRNQNGKVLREDDLEEISLAAMRLLANIGAEAFPETVSGFIHVFSKKNNTLEVAVFETMSSMAKTAEYITRSQVNLVSREHNKELIDLENNWRNRIIMSANLFYAFAFDKSYSGVGSNMSDIRVAAVLCMAASSPEPLPEDDAAMAKEKQARREKAALLLRRVFIFPEETYEVRKSVAIALGLLADPITVETLKLLINSPYIINLQARESTGLANAIIDSLVKIATSNSPGNKEARMVLLELLDNKTKFPTEKPGLSPVTISHLTLWRLQIIGKSSNGTFDVDFWKKHLNWIF